MSLSCRAAAAVAAALMLVLAVSAAPAPAEEPENRRTGTEGSDKAFVSVQVENDLVSGTDSHYTNGLRAVYLAPEDATPQWAQRVADAIPVFPDGAVRRYGLSLGHSIFTPYDTQATRPLPDQRPYAGWLYGGVGFVSDTGRRLDYLELQLGVVGPSALGETVQNDWHSLIGVEEAKGWDHQIKDEPAILLSYERKVHAWRTVEVGGFGADFTPHFGIQLGNVMTSAAAGGTFRLGFDLPEDYGPPRIRPGLTGSTYFVPGGAAGWYLFVGTEARYVARNIFLDGNTFRDSASVDKLPVVGDVQAGLAVTLGDVRVAYTHVLRSREFRQQADPDSFGSLSVSVRF